MSLLVFIFSVLICFGFASQTESSFTPIVQTESGSVRGLILKTIRISVPYSSFRGIPFAEPPIGNLRFKSPIPKEKWTGVFNATSEGNVCIQFTGGNSNVTGSEDCLIVNIFTPHTNFTSFKESDLKAVVVWIYGGAFIVGNSLSSTSGPDFLIEDDVIVVSLNYRLGSLGFLNLNHNDAPGNAGLKDQNLALTWINKNIMKFGGDPKRITIFGQSAGAASVDYHVLSRMSAGLFSRSLSISGSPLCLYWGLQRNEEARSQAFALASKLGAKMNDVKVILKTLKSATAAELVLKSIELPLIPFRPTIERDFPYRNQEKFLSECSVNAYISGNYNKAPHMIGFTSNEAKSFFNNGPELVLFAEKALEQLKYAKIPLDIPSIREVIETGGDLTNITNQKMAKIIKISSGLFFDTGIDTKQKLMTIHNNHPIYYYRFSYENNFDLRTSKRSQFDTKNHAGVGHGGDLPYLFYIPSMGLPMNNPHIQHMIDTYVRLITNFAKYGDPTPKNQQHNWFNITWPNSGLLGLHLEINKNLSIGSRPVNSDVEINEIVSIGNSLLLNDCITFKNC